MEVYLAENLGFCYGVKRAVKLADSCATPDRDAFTLGPIIHNPQMVARLDEKGVGMINSLDELDAMPHKKRGTVIIRSHGVGPEIYGRLNKMGVKQVDATCPHVKKAQMAAKQLSEENYQVIIIGEKKHPEVKSILAWAGEGAIAIETEEEAEALPKFGRIGIVAQTTFSGLKFKQIVLKLLDRSSDLKIMRTICTATDQRQAAAVKLAKEVDLMLVIGGRNSANTTRLAQLCAEECKTYHIETVAEVKDEWFENTNKIGITAGASTPDWIIKEVFYKCQKK